MGVRCLILMTLAPTISAIRLNTASDPGAHGNTLNFHVSQSQATMQEILNSKCEDQKMVDVMGPLVKSLSTFFQNDHHMTIYPWALTGLAALRYGGVSFVKNNGNAHTVDHDLDFLIQMPNATRREVDKMVKEWQSRLNQETGYKSYDSTPPGTNRLRNSKNNNLGASHYFIFVKKPSRTTEKMNEQGDPFWNDFYDKFMKGKGIEKQDFAREVKKRTKYTTMIDLWVKHDGRPLDEGYADSGKKMFFLGQAFPTPKNPEVLHGDILATFKAKHRIHKTKSLCDLAEPTGVIDEDSKPSNEESQRVQECSKILSNHGYFSISEQCGLI